METMLLASEKILITLNNLLRKILPQPGFENLGPPAFLGQTFPIFINSTTI